MTKRSYVGAENPNWNPDIKERPCPVCKKLFYPKHGRNTQVTCSFSCFKKIFIGRRPPHAKGGKRPNLNGQYFRSIWEANYARYLNYMGIKWEYEPQTFFFTGVTRGTMSYLPDFYLTNEKIYVEVKGWMRPTDRTKLKRMAKYHPEIDIVLLDKPAYLKLERQVSHKVPDWEYSPASQSQTNRKEAPLIKEVEIRLREAGLC